MTLSSMTGFACIDGHYDGWSWHLEIKTVNGKAFDLKCRLPYGMENLEADFRKLVSEYLKRGNITLLLQISKDEEKNNLMVNQTALRSILQSLNNIDYTKEAVMPATIDGILQIKGLVEVVEAEISEAELLARNKALKDDLRKVLNNIVKIRRTEGVGLGCHIFGYLNRIRQLVDDAKSMSENIVNDCFLKIKWQVYKIFTERNIDEDRLYQEAVLLATKSDIAEELDRLTTHIGAAEKLLKNEDYDVVGRKLDFLMQEFNREANTICSKSASIGLTKIGLELKSLIDRIKEQVQNIE